MGCRCGGGAEHEHAVDPDAASAKSLHQYVDWSQSLTVNAKRPNILENVLRAKFASGEGGNILKSDTDSQMIIKIQYGGNGRFNVYRFTGTVKIKAVSIHSDGTMSSPSQVKA
jgi:hypothetical protein